MKILALLMECLVLGMNGEHVPSLVEVETKQDREDVTIQHLNSMAQIVQASLLNAKDVTWIRVLHIVLLKMCKDY